MTLYLAKNFETSATSMHILVNLPVGDTPTSSASTTRLSSFPNRRHTADQGKGQCQKCPSSVCPSSSTSSFSWADVQMASLFIPIRTTPKRWRENRAEGGRQCSGHLAATWYAYFTMRGGKEGRRDQELRWRWNNK